MRAGVFVFIVGVDPTGTHRDAHRDRHADMHPDPPALESVPVSACALRKPYPFLRALSRASMGRLMTMNPAVKPPCRHAMESGTVPVSA